MAKFIPLTLQGLRDSFHILEARLPKSVIVSLI